MVEGGLYRYKNIFKVIDIQASTTSFLWVGRDHQAGETKGNPTYSCEEQWYHQYWPEPPSSIDFDTLKTLTMVSSIRQFNEVTNLVVIQ